MNNFVVRGFAFIGIFALLAVGFGNCAKPNTLSLDSASAAGADCWSSSAGNLIESCGSNVGIGTNAPVAKLQVAGGPTILQQEPWTPAMLQNGWTPYVSSPANQFAPASYFKDSNGVVHLRGLVVSTAAGFASCIFTLPPGYRPAYRGIFSTRFSTPAAEGGSRLDIAINGCVNVPSAAGQIAWLSLEPISFLAEQ